MSQGSTDKDTDTEKVTYTDKGTDTVTVTLTDKVTDTAGSQLLSKTFDIFYDLPLRTSFFGADSSMGK